MEPVATGAVGVAEGGSGRGVGRNRGLDEAGRGRAALVGGNGGRVAEDNSGGGRDGGGRGRGGRDGGGGVHDVHGRVECWKMKQRNGKIVLVGVQTYANVVTKLPQGLSIREL